MSLKLAGADRSVFDRMIEKGILADFREPDVIRMAPVPLYTSFEDVYQTGVILREILAA